MESPATEPDITREPAQTSPEGASPTGEAEIQYGPSGRRLYTWDELPPRVRLRAEHEGKWVAWSADKERILASSERFEDLNRLVKELAIDRVIYEHIDLPGRRIGSL